ncbi:unnamed protein product [Rhodiola kirilowii]
MVSLRLRTSTLHWSSRCFSLPERWVILRWPDDITPIRIDNFD